MHRINLLTRTTPGLMTDALLMENVLAQGGINARRHFPRGRNFNLMGRRLVLQAAQLVASRSRHDANVFIEQIMAGWIPVAQANLFIPNQEWVRPETIALLDRIDFVLCKTHYAKEIFGRRGHRVSYIGFSSEDRFRKDVKKNYKKFLHVAGRSVQKGTNTLAKVWAAHPTWPTLTIVTKVPELIRGFEARNIIVVTEPLSPSALIALQNECGVHLCPSEAEGFGLYICEALGCGAITITTDAPPMNELVTRERGLLVSYSHAKEQSLGSNFYVDASALEEAIEQALMLSDTQCMELSSAGREWFLANKADFERRVPDVIKTLLRTCA
jgi:glycosyltransferase involved in cell wall biosynthesis